MRLPGDLLTADPWVLAFRVLEPAPDRPRRLLVLLHGVDGDELQMAGLGGRADGDTHVVLARGPRSIAGDRQGWFREGHGEDQTPDVVVEEALESRARLLEFVGQLQQRFGLEAAQTVIGGFSQGAMLCAGAALHAPGGQGGVVMLAGRLLPAFDPAAGPAGHASSLRVLIVHGCDDAIVPVEAARDAQRKWATRGADVELDVTADAHELSAAMEDAFAAWWRRGFAERSPRPPGSP